MDAARRLNSTLAAIDEDGNIIAYSSASVADDFLAELLGRPDLRKRHIRIMKVRPYVWRNPDAWYAEQEPLLVYRPQVTAGV